MNKSNSEQPPQYASLFTENSVPGISDDGRVEIDLDSTLARSISKLVEIPGDIERTVPPAYSEASPWNLPLNIVIQVVGSRGDVQPFVAMGNELQKSGHRVRIATHGIFKTFVQSAGLEFFSTGGDPAELIAYMVKNPGLIPGLKTLKSGEIDKKRKTIAQLLSGCWRSCIEPDEDSGTPFVANAIIANPVSFAHIHCAQAMSIPLHMVFTMPWSPTRSYPHPLANITTTSKDDLFTNYLSHLMVQTLTWQGLGDVINRFRNQLGLMPIAMSEGPFVLETLKISYTYCWSASLVPKPKDWDEHINVTGFIFREPPHYEPTNDLAEFLASGPPPVYIGFGSVVVEDPARLLKTVLEAVKLTGVRAIISKGWSELTATEDLENVYMIDDCPHEWLFQHVSAVVHHGGAGTCAAGLLCGKPTTVIPFFGDQTFWGERIESAGAGPAPISYKRLTAQNLAEAIKFCLLPSVTQAAEEISKGMREERGTQSAVESFHRSLSMTELNCDFISTMPAVYTLRRHGETMKVSAPIADLLLNNGKVKPRHLRLFQPCKFDIENQRWDPFSSVASSGLGTTYDVLTELNGMWYNPYKINKQYKLDQAALDGAKSDDTINIDRETTSTSSISLTTSGSDSTKPTGRMAGAVAIALPRLTGAFFKGIYFDIPLAMAEGLRNCPKIYGDEVKPHRAITDWKSGAIVGGKEAIKGIGTGLIDLYVQPKKGYEQNGVLGASLGVLKGAVGTPMKVGAGIMSIYAYPAQGIWRTIYDSTHGKTQKAILSARRVHDIHFAAKNVVNEEDVLARFHSLIKGKKRAQDGL